MDDKFNFEKFSGESVKSYFEKMTSDVVFSKLKKILISIDELKIDEIKTIIKTINTKIETSLIDEYISLRDNPENTANVVWDVYAESKVKNKKDVNVKNKKDKYQLVFYIIQGVLQYKIDSKFFASAVTTIQNYNKSQTTEGKKRGGGKKNQEDNESVQLAIESGDQPEEAYTEVFVESNPSLSGINKKQVIGSQETPDDNGTEPTESRNETVNDNSGSSKNDDREGIFIILYKCLPIFNLVISVLFFIFLVFVYNWISIDIQEIKGFKKLIQNQTVSKSEETGRPNTAGTKPDKKTTENPANNNEEFKTIKAKFEEIATISKQIADQVNKIATDKQDPLAKSHFETELLKKVKEVAVKANNDKDKEFNDFKENILKAMKSESPKVDSTKTGSLKQESKFSEKDIVSKVVEGLLEKLKPKEPDLTNINTAITNINKLISDLNTNNKTKPYDGPVGSFAILITNSEDFKINSNILISLLETIKVQYKISQDKQKLGLYVVTTNKIDVMYDLKTNKLSNNATVVDSAVGKATESLGDSGQEFLEKAFDKLDTKKRSIIIATFNADAPKLDSAGWRDISQVDVILLAPKAISSVRYVNNWIDFTLKKNGRLLFVRGDGDFNFNASSSSITKLQNCVEQLLNSK